MVYCAPLGSRKRRSIPAKRRHPGSQQRWAHDSYNEQFHGVVINSWVGDRLRISLAASHREYISSLMIFHQLREAW